MNEDRTGVTTLPAPSGRRNGLNGRESDPKPTAPLVEARIPSPGAPEAPATETSAPSASSKKRSKGKIFALIVAAVLLAGVAGYAYLRYARQFEGTDDAYLEGNLRPVSARVNGTVAEVLTDDNRPARSGEPLLRLDPRDLQVHLEEAKGDLLSADAAVPQATAQISEARAQLAQAEAGIAQTSAQLAKAMLDFHRADELFKRNVSARAEYDTAVAARDVALANSASAAATREAAAATLHAAEAGERVALAKQGTAQANVRDAELQLSYATVSAPADGVVGKKSVEVGQRVQPGQALLAVVGTDNWVIANFKENQLARMQPGQPVQITVDAIADHSFAGTVESFSPGTGAKFSLLPPDNATGNFTKVVQRLPVKIRFTPESMRGYEGRLSPGLSAVVKVRVQP
ncbi:MAG TPA: HlyD family secretion protein [Chthoniobacterales bacterium]